MIPSLSVVHTVPSRRRNEAPCTLFPCEGEGTVQQAVHKPLEPDRDLYQFPLTSLAWSHCISYSCRQSSAFSIRVLPLHGEGPAAL
jgi:hypothetical protein